MVLVIYIAIILAAALLFTPIWADIVQMAGHYQENYRGRQVPQSMGGILPPVFLVAAMWGRWTGLLATDMLLRMLIVTIGFGILGLLDDIWGDSHSKGFGGHIRRFVMQGQITTGLVKAVAGFLLAMWAVAGLPGFWGLIFWRAALVGLSSNLINLLDLRPGRSLKGFFLLSLLYAWQVPSEAGLLLLFPFLLAALVYFPRDLDASGMLGDIGSNVLGGALGLVVVLTAPGLLQVIYFLMLVIMHVLAERFSLTTTIAKTPILRFFDNLGRHEWEK